jgi:hypothetical protein
MSLTALWLESLAGLYNSRNLNKPGEAILAVDNWDKELSVKERIYNEFWTCLFLNDYVD